MAWKKVENNIWKPKQKGDELEGEVIAVNPKGIYGYQMSVRTESGAEFLTPSQKALQSLLEQHNPKIGEKVRILFKDTKPSQKGKDTMLYDVFFDE